MKELIKKILPRPLLARLMRQKLEMELTRLPETPLNLSNLAKLSENQLKEVFHSSQMSTDWSRDSQILSGFPFIEDMGGVNAGDRRAIYYLISTLRPKRVLEIGTHIGASTIHIIAALRRLRETTGLQGTLTSVDLRDINDPVSRPWEKWGSKASPGEMARQMGASEWVRFVTSPSTDFLRRSTDSYDFIFLDGDHSAKTVYQEIPPALERLNPGGTVLLHDYYPGGNSLWKDEPAIYGPWLAVRRFKAEGAKLSVLPLGELPWETKWNSRVTSLALLVANA